MQHLFFGFCNLSLPIPMVISDLPHLQKYLEDFFEHLYIFDGYFRPTSSLKIFGGFLNICLTW